MTHSNIPFESTSKPFLELKNITKAYAGNVVLKSVEYSFAEGRVYGILGENGAGKSTLMRIISGLELPDRGTLHIDGHPVRFRAPKAALDAGITIMTQEQTLVPERSVAENVFMGQWSHTVGWVRDRQVLNRFDKLKEQVGFTHLDGAIRVSSLSLAARQKVEILRAVAHNSRMIIMDEPTAILSAVETKQLLELVQQLAAQGVAILMISHFLEDVLSVADDIIVLRDGQVTLHAPAAEQTPETLTSAMAGREVDYDSSEPPRVPDDAPIRLQVDELVVPPANDPVSVHVRAGEIVGLAGLIGSGRTELARTIFGADKPKSGTVTIDGRPLGPGSTRKAIKAGLSMVPENRKEEGLSLIHSIQENTSIVARDQFAWATFRTTRKELRAVTQAMQERQVKADSPTQPVWMLSGGNQQKVLFGKWTLKRPKVLIVDEPTRGVDVGAKRQIHSALRSLAAEGIAILLISSEIEEVMALSHRLMVMHRGRLVNEFSWGSVGRTEILRVAFGGVVADSQ